MNNKSKTKKTNQSNNNSPQTNASPIVSDNRVYQTNTEIEVAEGSKANKKENIKENETNTPKTKKIKWFENSKGWSNFFSFLIIAITVFSWYTVKTHFGIANKPNLQFSSFKIDSFIVGKPAIVSYELCNIGSYPIKIIESRTLVKIKNEAPDFNYNISQYDKVPLDKPNTIISKEYPLKRTQFCDVILDSSKVRLANTYGWHVYCIGFFRYKNLSNNQLCEYQFVVETTPYFGKNEFYFIVNENIDLN